MEIETTLCKKKKKEEEVNNYYEFTIQAWVSYVWALYFDIHKYIIEAHM